MGRLGTPIHSERQNLSSGYTYQISSRSGSTLDVHIFIDESGNVTQINEKIKEERLRYYIDPTMPQTEFIQDCLIGINDPVAGDCTMGIALGLGDNTYARAYYN
jgi:hypothetical protein